MLNPLDLFLNTFNSSKNVFTVNRTKRRLHATQKTNQIVTSAAVEIFEDRTLLDAANPDVTLTVDTPSKGEYWDIPTSL